MRKWAGKQHLLDGRSSDAWVPPTAQGSNTQHCGVVYLWPPAQA